MFSWRKPIQQPLGSATDGYEEAAFLPECANPAKLRQPTLGSPVVGGKLEKLLRIFPDERARIRSDVLDAVLGKPALNLRERVTMLFGMLILIAEPRLAPRRLVFPITQHRIKGNQPITRQSGDHAAQAEWDASNRIVEAEHYPPARPS